MDAFRSFRNLSVCRLVDYQIGGYAEIRDAIAAAMSTSMLSA
jgi:hypothetical protein